MTVISFDHETINSNTTPHKEVNVRLPKQWMHWAQSAGLRTATIRRHRGFHLRGRGRNWRVNCFGFFEASCPLEHFDRWANSRGAEVHRLPRTRAEFLDIVKRLHAASASAR